MKEYRPKKGEPIRIIGKWSYAVWPRNILEQARYYHKGAEVGLPTKSEGRYELFRGSIDSCEDSYFTMLIGTAKYDVEYDLIHSVEILPSEESESPGLEDLRAGMWYLSPPRGDFWHIAEQKGDQFVSIIGGGGDLYERDSQIVEAHNAVLEKLNERTIRQVCEDSGIPMKMTPDGIAFSMPDISFPNAFIARQFAQRIMQEVNALRVGDGINILHSDDPWVDGGEGGFSKSMTEAISDAIEQGGDAQRESMRKGGES